MKIYLKFTFNARNVSVVFSMNKEAGQQRRAMRQKRKATYLQLIPDLFVPKCGGELVHCLKE